MGPCREAEQILADYPIIVKGFGAVGSWLTNRLLAVENAPF